MSADRTADFLAREGQRTTRSKNYVEDENIGERAKDQARLARITPCCFDPPTGHLACLRAHCPLAPS